jgi:hyperosmotically inducible protein
MPKLGCWKMTLLAAMVATPLMAAGCGKTIGESIDDTTITTRVKTSMLNDPAVGGMNIDVDTNKGVVTLSGRVKSQAEHDQALALARKVDGVTEVKDALQIIP